MKIIEGHKALKAGSLLVSNHGDYKIESILGMGGFGITYKATKVVYEGNIAHKHTYAIKEFFCSDICMRNEDGNVVVNPAQQDKYDTLHKTFQEEAKLLSKLPNHVGFVSVNEFFDANNTSYYVMQYLDYSLTQKVQESSDHKFSEEEALDVFCAIAEAVAVLHENRRLHLDIKPDNIMFSGGTPCLIDFGNSRTYNKKGKMVSLENGIVCSDGYAPQEQYSGVETFSPPADIYSLGATLLYMLTGEDPIPANVISDAYIDEKLQNVKDARIKKIIHTSLASSPNSRYESVKQLLTSLNYISTGGTETTIIRDKHVDPRRKLALSSFEKIGKYALCCVLFIFIAWLVFLGGNKMLSSCSYKTVIDTIYADATDTTTVPLRRDTVRIRKIVPPQPKPQPDLPPESKPAPKQKSIDLGWAVWYGNIEAGKPNGVGNLEIKKEHKLFDDVVVYKGDKIIDCEFNEYGFYQGTLKRTDGTKEDLIR